MEGDGPEGCAKIGYESRKMARDALKKISRDRGSHGMTTYKCPRCSYWHLGRGKKNQKWRQSKKAGGTGGRYGPAE